MMISDFIFPLPNAEANNKNSNTSNNNKNKEDNKLLPRGRIKSVKHNNRLLLKPNKINT